MWLAELHPCSLIVRLPAPLTILLRPLTPINVTLAAVIAAAYTVSGRLEEGYEHALKSVAENDGWSGGWRMLASASGHLGRQEDADTALRKLAVLAPDMTLSNLRDWLPHRNTKSREYYLDGLRKAGLPE